MSIAAGVALPGGVERALGNYDLGDSAGEAQKAQPGDGLSILFVQAPGGG